MLKGECPGKKPHTLGQTRMEPMMVSMCRYGSANSCVSELGGSFLIDHISFLIDFFFFFAQIAEPLSVS